MNVRKAENSVLYRDFDIVLNGPHIRITPMLSSDEAAYARLMFGEMYDSFQRLGGNPPATGLDKVLSHESDDEIHAIRLLGEPSFIGWITLQRDESGRPDIGIHLIPAYQNQGIGPEAIVLLSNNLYEKYGIERVYIRTAAENIQAQKSLEKVGAVMDEKKADPMIQRINARLPQEDRGEDAVIYCYHLDLPLRHNWK